MLKKFLITAIGLAAASAMFAPQAVASTTTTGLWPVNSMDLRLGAFFPGSTGDKFFGGETQLTAGLDYRMSASGGRVAFGRTRRPNAMFSNTVMCRNNA